MRKPLEAKQLLAKAGGPTCAPGPKSLTELEAHQLVIVAHDRWVQQDRDNPSQQTSTGIPMLGPAVWARKPMKALLADRDRACDFAASDTPEDNIFRMERLIASKQIL
jgi:hypothetical protein